MPRPHALGATLALAAGASVAAVVTALALTAGGATPTAAPASSAPALVPATGPALVLDDAASTPSAVPTTAAPTAASRSRQAALAAARRSATTTPPAARPAPATTAPRPRATTPAAAPRPRATTTTTRPTTTSAPRPRPTATRPVATTPPPTTRAPAASGSAFTSRLLTLVNAARSSAGLRTLGLSGCAQTYAQKQAASMARRGVMDHQALGPVLSGCDAAAVGENVAYGDLSADAMFRSWMASPGHRANILSTRYTHMGNGAVTRSDGRVYASQVFVTL